jgi:two-component system, NtrC family, nitrogen regulation sensor histidine kinase NtrY
MALASLLPDSIKRLFEMRFSKLILAALCFLIAWLLSISVADPLTERGVRPFEDELHSKEKKAEIELDSLIRLSSNKNYTAIFQSRPERYNSLLQDQGIALLIYENDTLKFWSDNSAAVENYMAEVCLDDHMARLKNGWFEVIRKTEASGRIYIALVLVRNEYSYQNQYLVNTFQSDFKLPAETSLAIGSPASTNSIHDQHGNYLFTLVFKTVGTTEQSAWKLWLNIAFNVLGFVLVLLFLRSECETIAPTIGRHWSLLIFIVSVTAMRLLTIRIRFPQSFYELPVFGPRFYGDAFSFWLSNLGDFLINAVLILIFAFALTRYTRSITLKKKFAIWQQLAFGIALLWLPAFGAWTINGMISGLVQNSDISFNVNDIFSLNAYSYLGLLLIALLVSAFFLVANSSVRLFMQIVKQPGLRWNSFVVAALLHIGCMHALGFVDMITVLWPFWIVFVLLAWRTFTKESTFSFSLIVFLVFVFSLYATHMLLKQAMHKEHDSRDVFAEKLAAEQDPIAELLFTEFEKELSYDTILINSIQKFDPDYTAFEKRIRQEYFSGYWEKYDIHVAFFDTMCTPVIRSSTPNSDNILHYEERIEKNGNTTFSEHFFNLNSNSGRISYLAELVLQKPGFEKHLGQGTLFIELDSKLMSEEIGFPELLLDRELGLNQKLINYSYAKYQNNQLVNHAGPYQYSLNASVFGKETIRNKFIEEAGWEHLIHHVAAGSMVVLSKPDAGFLSKTTCFSYIFALFSLLLIIALSIRQLLTAGFTFSNLSFKYRIQLVLVLIVLVSLALFGGGSIYYIREQYQTKNAEIISEKAHSVLLEVEGKLEDNQLNEAYRDYATYLLKRLSNVFFTDVNLYDANGNLYASSRPKVFDEGLVSRKMNPEAYLQVNLEKRSEFIHDEHIGNLDYLSAYLPVKNKAGELQAYINLPYFAKQSDLEKEISSFLVALINVYVLLFALSVLAAIFISNYLTHPLRLIQEKMRQVKIGRQSEAIDWKNKDEIGSLVSEYNRMIAELAASAERLAQSERESAWREMAKQVAHEIKNPLTPMRLSIQLLQRAYNDKAPDIDQKVERLSKTMIEQIDTLSSIASAFSDFAKMPKMNNEEMDLKEVVDNTIELFHETSEATDFHFNANGIDLALICADKEQLPRVFNNLFRNAIQAIPEDRQGRIEVNLSKKQLETSENCLYVVSVRDNGSGISEEVIDKIFVPNFTTKSTGMGLGLAMVKNIVESCNGKIWFETEKDKGTTFFVSFREFSEE